MENGSSGRDSTRPMDYVDAIRADDARRLAREPAPGDANPASAPGGRPLDRRTRSP